MNFFNIFWRIWKYYFWKKSQGYSRETVSLIARKSFECDIESRYKNLSTIRNIKFIFQNFEISLKNSHGFWIINKFI